jgi:hypothetical protein
MLPVCVPSTLSFDGRFCSPFSVGITFGENTAAATSGGAATELLLCTIT